ncbi:TetR/AcrR family transcriptional regulator [Nonomuraea insulae]|uniref:TetR/AcrR family transcriptional regulator n=1 Tax=Nonomuraea insulae TaxID=1616787 RepID=A0ABW1DF64_9ACTN
MEATCSEDVSPPAEHTRRSELLRIAAEVFSRAGYSGTSLRDIADAAGILAGSLYHHFPSKESLAIELISAFHTEIDALADVPEKDAAHPLTGIVEFAEQVGRIAERHRAAVQMCRYDAPSSATEALSTLVRREPLGLNSRWAKLLNDARESGAIRAEVDPPMLRTVLSGAVLDLALLAGPDPTVGLVRSLTSLLLHGLATDRRAPARLDASAASRIAADHVTTWSALAAATGEGRRDLILATARQEFARRGYEATTIRDIAAASGVRPSSIYRHFTSKQEILTGIVERFSRFLLAGYEAVAGARSTAAERLDALCRLMASAGSLFQPEFVIVKDWWRVLNSPADAPPEDNATRLRLLESVISDGIAAGEFVRPRDPALLAVAMRATLWVPLGDSASAQRHVFLRQCLLDGAASAEERESIQSL